MTLGMNGQREGVTVHVTPADLDARPRVGIDIYDPVARALERQFPGAEFFVHPEMVRTRIDGRDGPAYRLPPVAQQYLAACDIWAATVALGLAAERPGPITFTLEEGRAWWD